jgi:hypothetical protein
MRMRCKITKKGERWAAEGDIVGHREREGRREEKER